MLTENGSFVFLANDLDVSGINSYTENYSEGVNFKVRNGDWGLDPNTIQIRKNPRISVIDNETDYYRINELISKIDKTPENQKSDRAGLGKVLTIRRRKR